MNNNHSTSMTKGSKDQKLNLKEGNTSMKKERKSVVFRGIDLKEIPAVDEWGISDLDFLDGIQRVANTISTLYREAYPEDSPEIKILKDLSWFMNIPALPDAECFGEGYEQLAAVIKKAEVDAAQKFLCCYFFSSMKLYLDLLKFRYHNDSVDPMDGMDCKLALTMEIFNMAPHAMKRKDFGQAMNNHPSIQKGKVS